MSARYWRLTRPSVASDTLQLGQLQLWLAGARVDSGATVTASSAPAAGTLSNLTDSDLETYAAWPRSVFDTIGFYIQWDLLTSKDANQVLAGAGLEDNFLRSFHLESSADSVTWTDVQVADTILWPGLATAQLIGGRPSAWTDFALAAYNGRDAQPLWPERTGKTFTNMVNAKLSDSVVTEFGTKALDLTVSRAWAQVDAGTSFDSIGAGDFDVEIEFLLTDYSIVNGVNYTTTLLSKDVTGARTFQFELRGTATSFTAIDATLFSAPFTYLESTWAYNFLLNTKYLARFRRASGVMSVYINGVKLVTELTNTTNLAVTTSPLAIGTDLYDSTYYGQFRGYIGKVFFARKALSAADYTPETTPFPNRLGMGPEPSTTPGLARRWRVKSMKARGDAELELGEFQLWAGGARADSDATLTASTLPATGSLAALQDDDATTYAKWNASALGSLVLTWSMPADRYVNGFKIGTATSRFLSLKEFVLQYSFDGFTWETLLPSPVGIVPFTAPSTMFQSNYGANKYKYHRLKITDWNLGEVRVSELQFFEDGTGVKYPDVTLTGFATPAPYLVTSSGQYNDDYAAWHAFDSIVGDGGRWISLTDSPGGGRFFHLTIYMGPTARGFSSFKLAPDQAISVSSGYYIKKFLMQGSNTGAFAGEEDTWFTSPDLVRADWSDATLKTFVTPGGYTGMLKPKLNGRVYGYVEAASSTAPIGGAPIAVHSMADKTLLATGVSDVDGAFEILSLSQDQSCAVTAYDPDGIYAPTVYVLLPEPL